MTNSPKVPFRETPAFQTVYKIGVGIKGFDGLVELLAGLALWLSPSLVHLLLGAIVGEAGEHTGRVAQYIADNVGRVDNDFAKSSLVFLVVFLVSHGLIKLALVYALLRRIVRVYPYALAVLGIFLLYQLYVLVVHPSISMVLFTVLDAIIIWLVWGEYKDLRDTLNEKVV
jgi:uncharacterized membrane protein